ncbi:DUF2798 domain-containing protein [Pseudomonas sp.]|uniref:DUF2798 domain-containing protein n=1 Tax=Pseudomonas sp. TaxID=306 RepID=UPI003525EB80
MRTKTTSHSIFGLPKVPSRFVGFVMPLILSIFMTCIVSLICTLSTVEITSKFFRIWMGAWGLSWVAAFPTLLLILPVVRKLTAAIVD